MNENRGENWGENWGQTPISPHTSLCIRSFKKIGVRPQFLPDPNFFQFLWPF
jgi:hypothetical protein